MKIKWLVTAFCCVIFPLTSCSGSPSNPGVAVQEKEGESITVGISIYDYDDDFMTLYREELKKYLDETYGAEVKIADGGGSAAVQDKQLEEFIKTAPDVMIINPVDASRTERMVDLCSEAGIPAVFINREPPESEIERWKAEKIGACYVGTDQTQAGTYQGEIVLSMPDHGDINGDGIISCIVITGEAGSQEAAYRTEYAKKAMEDGGYEVETLFEKAGNWQEDEGERLAAEALAQYKDEAEVILCGNDAMAIGAERALKRSGRTVGKDIYLMGVDALEPAVGMVRDGRMTGTVLNDYKSQAHMAADAAVKMAGGEKYDRVSRAGYIKIVMGE
ncbi:galactose ABC transporter substrate-binding protein [Clostridium sp. AM58-1XD]|uniref:galactose ABC transporter substrate-binding protein n=1 Tax=Clostridium sp. AM58-1XD TaxID=2292307 RepID=UPI000E525CFA|nr:galactose ABC transporter substrate-binding protein [Clostridium sp. AM58-1XD]RGZ00594.1 LacI family transcriptional regulator [Clostridium sp. AM58-1XD]